MSSHSDTPIFSAVSGSARQLYLLLKSIGFAKKALVQISEDGLRLSAEDTNVMEAMVFLDKNLFTTYHFDLPPSSQPQQSSAPNDGERDDEALAAVPPFEISITAFLEVLQIFGVTDSTTKVTADRDSPSVGAFDPRVVGLSCICRLIYSHIGGALMVVLTEGNISTSASLTAYEPFRIHEIPFDRQSLALKVIMKSSALYDAINELMATNPSRLTISASSLSSKLSLIAMSEIGSTIVDFYSDLAIPSQKKKDQHSSISSSIVETFVVPVEGKVIYDYKFDLVKQATRAMAMATKLSLRVDDQGVMNMQFMVELESKGSGGVGPVSDADGNAATSRVAFVDFRFVPFIREYEDEEGDDEHDGNRGSDTVGHDDLEMDIGPGTEADHGADFWDHSEEEL